MTGLRSSGTKRTLGSYVQCHTLPQRDDLAWIHDVLRVERRLDGPHRKQRRLPVFSFEVFHLALADAVLPREGPAQAKAPLHQPFQQSLGTADLVGIRHVDE